MDLDKLNVEFYLNGLEVLREVRRKTLEECRNICIATGGGDAGDEIAQLIYALDHLDEVSAPTASGSQLGREKNVGISWKRPISTTRKDVVGVRTLEDGRTEYLVYNAALCEPYYVAVDRLANATNEEIEAQRQSIYEHGSMRGERQAIAELPPVVAIDHCERTTER